MTENGYSKFLNTTIMEDQNQGSQDSHQNQFSQQSQASPVFSNPNNTLVKENLDVTLIYVLSIIGLVFCCCAGFIPAIIAYIISVQKINKYKINPEGYYGIEQLKTANIVALIIMILTLIGLLYIVFVLITSASDISMIMENYRNQMERY